MRSLLAPALVVIFAFGCADPQPAAEPPRTASAAPAKDEPELAKVTEADCVRWADHFQSRLREATRRRMDECDQRLLAAGRKPIATNAKDLQVTDAEAERLRGLIVEQCGQQVGAAYPKADAQCYLAQKTMEGWKQCSFRSMFFADYKAVAKNHQQMFDDRCKSALEQLSP